MRINDFDRRIEERTKSKINNNNKRDNAVYGVGFDGSDMRMAKQRLTKREY